MRSLSAVGLSRAQFNPIATLALSFSFAESLCFGKLVSYGHAPITFTASPQQARQRRTHCALDSQKQFAFAHALRTTLGIKTMSPSEYIVVGEFSNDTAKEMKLYLEMRCEEVVLSPGHSIQLLAMPSPNLLPLAIGYVEGGLQIYPHKEADPDWHVRFKGKLIRAGHPTLLSEHE
jgi:hypothetical protein